MKKRAAIIFTLVLGIFFINLVSAINLDISNYFPNFNLDYLNFFITIIPLIIMIIISYIAIKSGSRTFMGLQMLLWWIFMIYSVVRFTAWLHEYANIGLFPRDFIDNIITIPTDKKTYDWYIISLIINAIAGVIFSFKNEAIFKLFRKNP